MYALRIQGSGNAAELHHLDWATEVAGLDASTLAPATKSTFTLPATYKSSQNYVVVKPSWGGTAWNHNLYLSLKRKVRVCSLWLLPPSLPVAAACRASNPTPCNPAHASR